MRSYHITVSGLELSLQLMTTTLSHNEYLSASATKGP